MIYKYIRLDEVYREIKKYSKVTIVHNIHVNDIEEFTNSCFATMNTFGINYNNTKVRLMNIDSSTVIVFICPKKYVDFNLVQAFNKWKIQMTKNSDCKVDSGEVFLNAGMAHTGFCKYSDKGITIDSKIHMRFICKDLNKNISVAQRVVEVRFKSSNASKNRADTALIRLNSIGNCKELDITGHTHNIKEVVLMVCKILYSELNFNTEFIQFKIENKIFYFRIEPTVNSIKLILM